MLGFILAQLIGLYVVNFYVNNGNIIPYGFDQKDQIKDTQDFQAQFLVSLIIGFIIAILFIFFLMKIKSQWLFKIWFFLVVLLALSITLNVFLTELNLANASWIALFLGLVFAYFKIFRRNIMVHNLTELLIYPGIATIFSSLLSIWTIFAILILISIYDMWAVWKSKLMLKMAKFQIDKMGVFGGFLIPYANKKIKEKIEILKMKYKNKKIPENIIKKNKLKVNVAMLGGGDIVFPMIAISIFYNTFHSLLGALIVMFFAFLALAYLLFFTKKGKAYPAMPYLTIGIFFGMLVAWFTLGL